MICSGIILAAGLSSRMGSPKQLLPFREKTIIETVIANMINSKFDEVIVVLGHAADLIRPKIPIRPKINIIENENYRSGMLSSIKTGISAIKSESSAIGVMLVDLPLVTSEIMSAVITAHFENDHGITVPSYKFRRGHPVIFANRYIPKILELPIDGGGLRTILRQNPNDIFYHIVNSDVILTDLDTKEDYEKMKI